MKLLAAYSALSLFAVHTLPTSDSTQYVPPVNTSELKIDNETLADTLLR